ncbi:hypothetical protein [uncultured Hymenobacter sp.]|uniref:hypothetical protein n=1 Tax=uncultured Hymenobacter sp. TaxID=170016 RepID=UPI0035CC0F81
MIREIMIPTSNILTLELPDDLVGKEIEVLAFELRPTDVPGQGGLSAADTEQRLAHVRSIFDGVRVDLSNYKFDRDEANNYDG